MGGAASSQARLRKAIIIKAYNCRESNDDTFHDQFKKLAFRKNGSATYYISIADIKRLLALDAQWVDQLFLAFGEKVDEIEFPAFIEYLESGKMPTCRSTPPLAKTFDGSLQQSPNRPPLAVHGNVDRDHLRSTPTDMKTISFPPQPPRSHQLYDLTEQEATPVQDRAVELAVYIEVLESLGMRVLDFKRGSVQHDVSSTELVVGSLTKISATKPLWRKREVVRQERIVQYTTVDAYGELQELCEKEVSETEIVHMECRETGEFAHRETTNYEQTETFNNEIVAEQRGKEEYVHLKSLQDEFEYMESNMPKKSDEQESAKQAAAADECRGEHSASPKDGATSFEEQYSEKEDMDYPEHWSRHPGDGTMGGARFSADFGFDPKQATSPDNLGTSDQEADAKYGWGLPRFSNDFASGTKFDQKQAEAWYASPAKQADRDEEFENADERNEVEDVLEKHNEYLKARKQKLFEPASPEVPDQNISQPHRNWADDDID